MDTANEDLDLTYRDLAIREEQDLGHCVGGMEIRVVHRRGRLVEKTDGGQLAWDPVYAALGEG